MYYLLYISIVILLLTSLLALRLLMQHSSRTEVVIVEYSHVYNI